MRYLTWTTKDGVVMNVKDMTDKHLVNSIRMLERKQEKDHKHAVAHLHDHTTIASASDCLPEPPPEWFEDPRYAGLIAVARGRGILLDDVNMYI